MHSLQAPKKKVLFLYYELAGYIVAGLKRLAAEFPVEIHLVRYPVVSVAPFRIELGADIHVYERREHDDRTLKELVRQIQPDAIFVCGWADRGYLKALKSAPEGIPRILTMDNPWRGTIKQYLAAIAGPLILPRMFTRCWVPGEPNAEFARKLGFNGKRLYSGLYSADTALYHSYRKRIREDKRQRFPHRFVFAGRYTALKGIRVLWEAFASLSDEERKDWELWCVGNAEPGQQFPDHPAIRNIGFVQPDQMETVLRQTGVFILPAKYEHWGVVVHEFAIAGFPLLCTGTTSAATAFLKDGENGFLIAECTPSSIREALARIISLTDERLNEMGDKSQVMSAKITTQSWCETAFGIINGD